jgi:hypothetical protein
MIEHVINTVPIEFKNIISAVPVGRTASKGYFGIERSRGPADTALQVLDYIEPDSCLIMDSDILNFTNDLYILGHRTYGCGVLVCYSANPAFSYVDQLGAFNHIKEKERISGYAVRGAYYVSNPAIEEFKSTLELVVDGKEEPYISHAFDFMKCSKSAVETTYVPIDWSTPHDLKLSGARIVRPNWESSLRGGN